MRSDLEPIGKGRVSSDRIDRDDHYRGESPAKRLISRRSIRGRYLTWRSITYRLRSITSNNTAREKYLQIAQLDHCAVDAVGTFPAFTYRLLTLHV